MKSLAAFLIGLAAAAWLAPANAEILALVLYESKAEESIRSLRVQGEREARREGIAIIDVDPESEGFGDWLADFPLPPTLVSHHMYYNNERTKIYITALGDAVLHVLDVTRVPYRLKAVPVPECKISENMAFSADGARYYVACLGSHSVLGRGIQDPSEVGGRDQSICCQSDSPPRCISGVFAASSYPQVDLRRSCGARLGWRWPRQSVPPSEMD